MKRPIQYLAALAVAGALAAPSAARAQAAPPPLAVDLELSLLVDVSGSVNATEYALQRNGYVAAFNNPALWTAISQGALKRIAVNYVQWASTATESIGWTLIDSEASMNAFAAAIGAAARPTTVGSATGIGTAISFATPRFFSNSFVGAREIIDISGDGCSNSGTAPATARDAAVAAGVDVINGIVINPSGSGCDLVGHYTTQVIAGATSFVLTADTFDDFQTGIERKLIREITTDPTAVPEPSTVILLGTGLATLAGVAIRRRKQS